MILTETANTPQAWSERARTHTEPWDACGWSREGQYDRLAAVLDELDPQPGETLLDWGCGTGELCSLLLPDVKYHGYDWAKGMVARARREHPGRTFSAVHPPHYRQFDLVACVGPFNLEDGWSKQHTWHTLRHLWDTTGCRSIAVSLYKGDDDRCLRYEEHELHAFGRSLGPGYFIDEIRPNDLLFACRR